MEHKRINYSSGAPLEEKVGYSRMVKIDDQVFIGGTTSVQPDGSVYGETAYEQSLIGYFPITDDCFAACIISLYADGAESYAAEEELTAYLETAAAALTFEDFVTE